MVALETVYQGLAIVGLLGFLLYVVKALPALARDRYERGKRGVPDENEE